MAVDGAPEPTRLIVVRHGESNVTVQRMIGGMLTCTGLSDLGRAQAGRLRDRIGDGLEPPIDEIWSSTMPRAHETASIINEALQLELSVDPDFEEFRPGEADGMLFADYVTAYGPIDQMAEPHRQLAPGGESRVTFFARVGAAFDRLIQPRAGKTVMVVCHGGVVDIAFRRLLAVHSEAPFQLWTTNAAITEFITTSHGPPRRWRLARYNDAAHLVGLPTASHADND